MDRKIRAVVFDVDGTLISEISWQTLNLALGVTWEMDQRLFKEYHEGRFTYQEWVDKVVEVYKRNGPVPRRKIVETLGRYTLAPHAQTVFQTLRGRSYLVGIISGGLDLVVDQVARQVQVQPEHTFSNSSILFDAEDYLEKIVARGQDHEVKLADLHRLCQLWGIPLNECAYVGDGHADYPLFMATGNGITFNSERCSMLHGSCWRRIAELPDLLHFL